MTDGYDDTPFGRDAERDEGGPDLRGLLARAVARSWPSVALLALAGAAAGLLAGLGQPNAYSSEAKLLLRVGARERVTSETLVNLDADQRPAAPTMQDELQLLSDPRVFEQVARELGPRNVLQPADPAREDGPDTPFLVRLLHRAQARLLGEVASDGSHACEGEGCASCLRLAAKVLREETTIANDPGSSVISVAHSSSSPERAQSTLAALTEAFIARHREQFSIQELVERSHKEVEHARRARDVAASAYLEHVNASGSLDPEADGPIALAAVSAVENELFAARMRREEIARQRATLTARLQTVPAQIEVDGPSVMVPNEEYETRLALKRSLLAQRQTLSFENRPIEERRRIDAEFDRQIAEVNRALANTPKAVTQAAARRENAGHSALSTRVGDLEVEDEALVVKVELLRARLSEKSAAAEKARRAGLLAALQRRDLATSRDAEEARYRQVLDRFSALQALGSIDFGEANLQVMQAASFDPEKTGPNRPALLAAGLGAGLLLGAAWALLRQSLDKRLHDPEAFEDARGVPVLGVVPHLPALARGAVS